MINELIAQWDGLPDSEKREIANFVSRKMQKSTKGAAELLLSDLNKLAGRNYRPVPANISKIQARLAEGYTFQDIGQVIARKCLEWRGNPQMEQYLRPKTLFAAENFSNYHGQLGMEVTYETRQQSSQQRKSSVAERATEARREWERNNPTA